MKHALLVLFAAMVWMGCRGGSSGDPPVHLNRNMDFQKNYGPQEENPFFSDNRAMRPPVPGTVARGMLREDSRFYDGRNENGSYVDEIPVPMTRELIVRGQHRFDIFCAPCHGRTGDGEGIITAGGYGYTPAPTFHSDRLRDEMQDGYLFDVITRGIRTMPAYAHQVPVADRWAIVAYIRALQRSQYAQEDDIPASALAEIEQQSTGAGAGQGGAGTDEGTGADTTGADTTGEDTDTEGGAANGGATQNGDGDTAPAPSAGGNQ